MKFWHIAVGFLALTFFAATACSSESQQPAEEQAATTGETAAATAEALAEDGDVESAEEAPPGIMDTPLDGSSVEAFKAGLQLVDEEATEKQYRSLMSALDYLLLFDISVKRKKELLYARLDGYTPNQIIKEANDKRSRKRK